MTLFQTVNKLELEDLTAMTGQQHERVLQIRNQPEIRNNMYDDSLIGLEEHASWVNSLKCNDRAKHYAVILEGEIIGCVSLSHISKTNKRADWAFYLDGAAQGKGLGSALEFKFMDRVFETVGLEKLNCEVMSTNAAVVRLHKKFGFVEEGLRRNHIIRDGHLVHAHLLGITKDEWAQSRARLREGAFR